MLVILPGVQHPTSAGEVDLQELLPEHLSQGGVQGSSEGIYIKCNNNISTGLRQSI